MEMQIEEEWSRSFEVIKSKHNLAYKTIETAIRNEEQEQPEAAMINYKLGISLIDEGLSVQVAVPDDLDQLDETWSDACKMIHKMKRTRGEVLQRLTTLGQKYELVDMCVDASDGASSASTSNGSPMRPRTYFELSEELRSMRVDDKKSIDAMELLFSCEGVKLFYISDTGSVTTSSEDSVLRIVEVAENLEKKLERTYFLQIVEKPHVADPSELQDISTEEIVENDISWVYPLYPGTSPCYRTDFGAFVFPDLQADQPGCAIGIVIPCGSNEIVTEILESLLHGIVKQGLSDDAEQLRRTRRATADTVSRNLVKGAYCISNGLVKGSEKIGQFVTYSTPFVISKITSAPNNAAPVSERVVNGVEIAKSATTAAASITGYVAGKVGSATMALGKFLAPHIQRQGSKLLTSAGYSQEEANETMTGVLNVTSGAVEGFSTVYSGLEKSAGILGTSLSNNSVKIIEHKYGPSAGEVASGAFDTVGNMIHVSHNVNYMTPKGLAKKAAKHTGKAIVSEFRAPLLDVKYVPAGSLFPDLSEFAKAAASKQ
ncbi:protein spartin isoform X2 [Bradysia coprophila]|nr:protein spartin isoform X2 [Bradysia coprophila]